MKDYPVVFMLGFFVTVVFNRWVTIFQYIGFTDKWVFQQFYIKKNIFIFKNQTILIVLFSRYVKFYIWTFKTFSTLVTFIKNYSFMKLGKKIYFLVYKKKLHVQLIYVSAKTFFHILKIVNKRRKLAQYFINHF